MNSPILDNRDKSEVFNRLLELARFYVPEWNKNHSEEDLGLVLINIFSEMFAETIKRYNQMPYKNFIYFLDLCGANIRPSVPSRGYITVETSQGRDAFIKKGTKVYGEDSEGEKIIFETEDDLHVVENRITDIFCKDGKNVIVHSFNDENPHMTKLFDFYGQENLQRRSIAISAEHVLNIKNKSQIYVHIVNTKRPFTEDKTAALLANPDYATWYFAAEQGLKKISVTGCIGNKIIMNVESEIPVSKWEERPGRWLCCVIDNAADSFEISLTGCCLSAQAEKLEPEQMYSNDLNIMGDEFLPFGERFGRFDSFYIGSEEVFTKKGAVITLEFTFRCQKTPIGMGIRREIKWKSAMPASEFNEPDEAHVCIEDIIWEYWNGNGWVRLAGTEAYGGVFKYEASVSMSFICPDDIAKSLIGGSENYFIRSRIHNVSNVFTVQGYYVAPVIGHINLSYDYKNGNVRADRIYILKDLELTAISRHDETELILSSETEKLPTAYMALKNPLPKGLTKLYFQNYIELKNPPPLKFEYFGTLNGSSRWLELKVIDETEGFAGSGLITFICRGKFERLSLFSRTAYWIRIINTDKQYENIKIKLPCFKGMYFNTVKIKQLQTMETEYFSVEFGEVNKVCELTNINVYGETVWVNEFPEMMEHEAIDSSNGVIVKDDFGNVSEYWVKWNRVQTFSDNLPLDRVYILDAVKGTIIFGNGKKGKVPTSGDGETIKVDYSTNGGSRGNLGAYSIGGFAQAVAVNGMVYNVEPIVGGCDIESLEDAIKRSSKFIKHQNRIVSGDDCEIILSSADRNVVKVRVYAEENGGLTVVVLPRHINSPGDYFSILKKRLTDELKTKAPAVLTAAAKINVIEVTYIEFSVAVNVTIADYHCYQEVYEELEKRLREYFDPVTGNFDGKGFDIGRLPTKVQILNYIKSVNILNINAIHVSCFERIKDSRREIDYDKAVNFPYAVPVSGEPEIDITVAVI